MGLLRSILTAPDGLTTTSSRLSCWVKSGLFSTTLTVSNFRMSRHTVSDAALRSVTSDKLLCRVYQRTPEFERNPHLLTSTVDEKHTPNWRPGYGQYVMNTRTLNSFFTFVLFNWTLINVMTTFELYMRSILQSALNNLVARIY